MALLESSGSFVRPRPLSNSSGSAPPCPDENIGLSRLSPDLRKLLADEMSGFEILKQCTNCDFSWTSPSLCFNVNDDKDQQRTSNQDETSNIAADSIYNKGLSFCGRKLEYCLKCKGLEIHNHYSRKGMHGQKLNLGGFCPVLFNNVIKTCKSTKKTSECHSVTLGNRPRSSPAIFMVRSPETEDDNDEDSEQKSLSSSVNLRTSMLGSLREPKDQYPLSPSDSSSCLSPISSEQGSRNLFLPNTHTGNLLLDRTSNGRKRSSESYQVHVSSPKTFKFSNSAEGLISIDEQEMPPLQKLKTEQSSFVSIVPNTEYSSRTNDMQYPELLKMIRNNHGNGSELNAHSDVFASAIYTERMNSLGNSNIVPKSANEDSSDLNSNKSSSDTYGCGSTLCFPKRSEILNTDVKQSSAISKDESIIEDSDKVKKEEGDEVSVDSKSCNQIQNIIKGKDNEHEVFQHEAELLAEGRESETQLQDSSNESETEEEASVDGNLVIVLDDENPKYSSSVQFDKPLSLKKLSSWTNKDVVQFLENTDCKEYAAIFEQEDIDGKALELLDEEKINKLLGIKIGPAMRIASHIRNVKERVAHREENI